MIKLEDVLWGEEDNLESETEIETAAMTSYCMMICCQPEAGAPVSTFGCR